MHRRGFLLSTASVGPAFLHQRSLAVASPLATRPSAQKAVIHVELPGGLSHLDSFDPKPDAPAKIRGDFETIPTALSGVRFSQLLPNLAGSISDFCIIRSLSHSLGDHAFATRYSHTGEAFSTQATPSIGAIIAREVGLQIPPPFIGIPVVNGSAGSLGPKYRVFNAMGDAGNLLLRSPQTKAETARFVQRSRLLKRLDANFNKKGRAAPAVDGRDAAYEQAIDYVKSAQMRSLLQLDTEPQSVIDSYGDTDWGRYLLLARRFACSSPRLVDSESPYVMIDDERMIHEEETSDVQSRVQAGSG